MWWTFCKTDGHLVMFPAFPPESLERYEIMQFTGLLDKNGKEIYEGDIVKGSGFTGEILFTDFAWMVHRFDADGEVEETVIITDYKLEVIGNKFENPELLEAKP